MSFANPAVPLDQLPASAELEFEPMSPRYPREVLVQQLVTWLAATAVAFVPYVIVVNPVDLKAALAWLPAVPVLLGALVTTIAWLRARRRGVALRRHDIAYRSGLFWCKDVLLPFNRVQHLEVSVGPLQRRFRLASLKFFTAGGASVDLRMDGLDRERAREIRDFVIGLIRERRDG